VTRRIVSSPRFQCVGKMAFGTRAAATRQLVMVYGSSPGRDLMEVYNCPKCKSWHFGHAPGSHWALLRPAGKPWNKRPRDWEKRQALEESL